MCVGLGFFEYINFKVGHFVLFFDRFTMKTVCVVLFLFLCIPSAKGQSLVEYTDTVHHFSVKIPVGWKYGVLKNQPSVKLIAYRTPTLVTDTVKSNFNVNIIETPNLSLEETYDEFLQSISKAANFRLIKSGNIVIQGKNFKWLIESHHNHITQIPMHNYVFLTYQKDKTYILTLATFSEAFIKTKELFDQIADSFKLTD